MSLPVFLFAVVASATAASALGVVLAKNIVRQALWLLFTLIGVSLVCFLLGAEFVGAAQLIVYVGGTLVLVVFGVMLTASGPLRELKTRPAEWAVGGILGGTLFGLLVAVALGFGKPQPDSAELPGTGQLGLGFLGVSEASGKANMTGIPDAQPVGRKPVGYLLPFEIVSVHLLVVLIGAAYLARAKRRPREATRG